MCNGKTKLRIHIKFHGKKRLNCCNLKQKSCYSIETTTLYALKYKIYTQFYQLCCLKVKWVQQKFKVKLNFKVVAKLKKNKFKQSASLK